MARVLLYPEILIIDFINENNIRVACVAPAAMVEIWRDYADAFDHHGHSLSLFFLNNTVTISVGNVSPIYTAPQRIANFVSGNTISIDG